MRSKYALGQCSCCGDQNCAWLIWNEVHASGRPLGDTGNPRLVATPPEAHQGVLESGYKLKTAIGSPFVANGQLQVTLLLSPYDMGRLDLSGGYSYGNDVADWCVRMFIESDEEEENYKFADVKIMSLGWEVNRTFNPTTHAVRREQGEFLITYVILIEIGRRVGGVDTVLGYNIQEMLTTVPGEGPGFFFPNDRIAMNLSLSRISCGVGTRANYDKGFCFDGYAVTSMYTTHRSNTESVNRPLRDVDLSPGLLSELQAFNPPRQHQGLDPGASFAETLVDPPGTYAGVMRLGADDVATEIIQFNVGKYEKGLAGTAGKPYTGQQKDVYAPPVTNVTGDGAAYVRAGTAFGFSSSGEEDSWYSQTLYGKITYDPATSPSRFIQIANQPNYSDLIAFGSIPSGGGYVVALDQIPFRVWLDEPEEEGVYEFEIEFTAYPNLNHSCFVWPMPYTPVCTEKAIINFSPSFEDETYGTATVPTPQGFGATWAPGAICNVGTSIFNGISQFSELLLADPQDGSGFAIGRTAIYRASILTLLGASDAYIAPGKVWDNPIPQEGRLNEFFAQWEQTEGIWIPKQAGEPGFLNVWVEVVEGVSDARPFTALRSRYYGFFGAIPVNEDTIDCDGLSFEFATADAKAYKEILYPSLGSPDPSVFNLQNVTIGLFKI